MLVAVYGTLKRGRGNHHLLTDSQFIGECRTAPEFTMYSLGFCPAITASGDTAITIEVYDVDKETFGRLDSLEGYPHFYNRKVITTEFGDAWVYFIPRAEEDWNNHEIVEDGTW